MKGAGFYQSRPRRWGVSSNSGTSQNRESGKQLLPSNACLNFSIHLEPPPVFYSLFFSLLLLTHLHLFQRVVCCYIVTCSTATSGVQGSSLTSQLPASLHETLQPHFYAIFEIQHISQRVCDQENHFPKCHPLSQVRLRRNPSLLKNEFETTIHAGLTRLSNKSFRSPRVAPCPSHLDIQNLDHPHMASRRRHQCLLHFRQAT